MLPWVGRVRVSGWWREGGDKSIVCKGRALVHAPRDVSFKSQYPPPIFKANSSFRRLVLLLKLLRILNNQMVLGVLLDCCLCLNYVFD